MEPTHEEKEKLVRLFSPYAHEKFEHLKSGAFRFAHYTSAETAIKIIKNGEVWLRNARVMNDFSEISHGQGCLATAWRDDDIGKRFQRTLQKIDTSLHVQLESLLDGWHADRLFESYLFSITEHGESPKTEADDRYGRLSMWRAYGGNCNVAFVFNSAPFYDKSGTLGIIASPVHYLDQREFLDYFRAYVQSIEDNLELIKSYPVKLVSDTLFWVFHFAALSLKHPGFSEEREWRIILSPTLSSDHVLKKEVRTIDGIPQVVYI